MWPTRNGSPTSVAADSGASEPECPLTDSPAISVVIPAYNRRPYLSDAIKSLRAQTTPLESFEVIVVATFSDSSLERRVREMNGTWLEFREWPCVGEALSLAVDHSHGRVISFLDDDDMFSRQKLAAIQTVFAQHPSVGYHHHAVERVNKLGETTSRQPPRPRKSLIVPARGIEAGFSRLMRYDGAHNLSAISVRSAALRKSQSFLSRITGATDRFMFYATLASEQDLFLDSRVLSQYRSHDQSAIHSHSGTALRSPRVRFGVDRVYRTSLVIQEMLSSANRARIVTSELQAQRAKQFAVTAEERFRPSPDTLVDCLLFGVATLDYEAVSTFFFALLAMLTGTPADSFISRIRRSFSVI